MGKDLIIGSASNYKWNDIKVWVRSIKKTGFEGDIAIIAYNMDKETCEKLTQEKVILFGFKQASNGSLVYENPNLSVVVERFGHLWHFLRNTEYNNVIATDVRDVVFQKNPSDWLREYEDPPIVVAEENFIYKDEPWNVNNMKHSFGELVYDSMQNMPIICAGVIAGSRLYIQDLCLQIFMMCAGAPHHVPGGGGPDQAALNILMRSRIYNDMSLITNSDNGFILHAGTTMKAIEAGSGAIGQYVKQKPDTLNSFEVKTLCEDPILTNDLVTNAKGTPYYIVHQYDRVPQFKEKIQELYGD